MRVLNDRGKDIDPKRIVEISQRQVTRLEKLVVSLDAKGIWNAIQKEMDELWDELRQIEVQARNAFIDALIAQLEVTLLDNGADPGDVSILCYIIRTNWNRAFSEDSRPCVREIYLRSIDEWKKLNRKLRKDLAATPAEHSSWRRVLGGVLRLVTGGGSIAFDIWKVTVTTPMPQFIYTTVLVGAGLFLDGIERVFRLDAS